ncbi:TonB-dependent siderophore receptor [Rheinheimera sp.]|uniref:TonB-dependent receptor n=1 Tax=Rheinheimera sp. TaxID=1869214 RepID=UPI002736F2AF|nr:TonB-dependent receptor [Rheinheimera sp.]MDP2713759.1 TonB-dependent receptor [Rheinheimera sp.]
MAASRPHFIKTSLSQAVQLALVSTLLAMPVASAAEATGEQEKIERISVYGTHNQLILASGTATKSDMALMQTPAAVVVVDSELLASQNNSTLQEALRNISGLGQAGNNYGIGDTLILRGLGVNYTYDGMYGGADLGNSYNPTRSMTNIESLEVLKGPATGLYGIGAAGGVINMVEKKPLDKAAYQVNAKAGAWNTYALGIDATGALQPGWAYRVVANHERSDGFRNLTRDRDEVYASVRFQPNKQQQWLLSAAYIDDANQIDSNGDPVRVINWDSVVGGQGKLTAEQLPNDPQGPGLQLTEAQRAQLAASILATDGTAPYRLGKANLISPLATPNMGEELRIKLRHDWDLSQSTTLSQQLLWRSYDSDFVRQTGAYNYLYWQRSGVINADPRAPLVLDGELYPFAARRQEYRRQQSAEDTWQYFADLTSKWRWANVTGEHLVSVNAENRDMRLTSWSAYDADGAAKDANAIPYILDIRQANWPTADFMSYSPVLTSNYDKAVTAYGVSLQEVLYLSDALTARAGIAYTRVEQQYQHKGTDRAPGIAKEANSDDAGTTYNLGLNYQFTPQLAAFVNRAQGRTAYSVLGAVADESTSNELNRPDSESKSFDVGLRFTAFDENLLGSLVWFETRRTNLRYNNPEYNDNPNDPEFNIGVPRYFFDDEDQTKGFEFDLNLVLAERWRLNVNGIVQDAIEIRAQTKSGQTKGVPEKTARAWLSYQLPLVASAKLFEASLGASYESERSINSVSFGIPEAFVPAYTRWDMALRYNTDNVKVQLNLENLFNKYYYSKALFLGGLPGNERNVKLTISYQF